jgi:ABC-type nitrate/sulfonate/bicarbonate transport system permease component
MRRLRRWLPPLVALALWQVLASRADPRDLIPTPDGVVRAGVELIGSGELPIDLSMSLVRAGVGFALALVIATVLATAMATSRELNRWLEPIVETLRPVSPVALAPLAILWFGTGPFAPISIVVYAAVFPALLNTLQGIRDVDPALVSAARTLGVGRFEVIRQVLLPGAIPGVLVGARLAFGNAWRSLILAELLVGARSSQGVSGGIGALMFSLYSYQVDLRGIVVCMLVAGAVGLSFDRGLRWMTALLTPWATADT